MVLAWGRRGIASRSRPRSRARSRRSASTPTSPWSKLPDEHKQGDPLRRRAAQAARKKKRGSGLRRHRPAPRSAPRRRRRRATTSRRRRSRRERRRHRRRRARTLRRHAHVRRVQGRAPPPRSARREARRARTSPSSARMPLRALAHVRRRARSTATTPSSFSARERAIAEPLLKRGRRAPRLPHRRRPRLPHARSQRADALVAARASASASRRRSAPRSSASSTCSTSRASACTRATTRASSRRKRACAISATRVIVVEHDREAILAADHVVDMGPGAGVHGGQRRRRRARPREIMANPKSITGPVPLRAKRSSPSRQARKPRPKTRVRVVGARAHNLQNVTVEIPLGLFTCVTGVSRQRQVEPHRRHAAARGARRALLRDARRSASATRVEGPRAHRQGRLDRPGAHRPHAALEPRDVHRRLRALARALRGPARSARARLQGRAASRST